MRGRWTPRSSSPLLASRFQPSASWAISPGVSTEAALSSMRPYLSLKPPCDLQNIFFTEESATPTAQDPQARIEVLSCLLSFFHQLRHKWFIRA
jgi:hypothetical protein